MNFSSTILNWYQLHKRDLPWRTTQDPYRVWLSEIILQQTRVNQGLPYYLKFVEAFPSIFELAKADEQQVLKLWQGLGYYSRARNLHQAAKTLVEKYQGVFPQSYPELKKLKGVGDYTASAISSICFNEPHAVVDGNVYRVLSRVFGIKTPIDSSAGQKEFKLLAQKLLDKNHPGKYNQAVMEFGAIQCTPMPQCSRCVFAGNCYAFQKDEIQQLPVKARKTKIRQLWFHYLVVISEDGKTIVNKRSGDGIWKNLYEFPNIVFDKPETLSRKRIKENLPDIDVQKIILYNEKPIIHKLSHRHLHISFWLLHAKNLDDSGVLISQIGDYPVPVVLQKFITDELLWRIKN